MLDFADTCVFAKQSLGPILCGSLPLPLARSGRVPEAPLLPKLRGHFAEFLLHKSLAHLRLLALPTCVRFRYGHKMYSPPRLFSAACLNPLGTSRRRSFALRSRLPGLLAPGNIYRVGPGRPSPGWIYAPASPLRVVTRILWFRNIDLIPIVYALRPRLRDRLTRGGRAWPRNP